MPQNNVFAPAQIRTARIRTSIGFVLYGLVQGLWLVQIPLVVDRLSLDTKTFGLVVLVAGIGSAIAQPFAGWAVGIFGSRRATRYSQPAFFVMIPLLILAPNVPFLFVASFVLGLVGGPLNVAINTQATEVENARGRATMPSFHGWFSVGSVASASIVALLIWLGLGSGSGIIIVALLAIGFSLWTNKGMLPPMHRVTGEKKRGISLPTGAVIGIAIIIFFSNAVEGGTSNFNSLFLASVKGANLTIAGAGFTFYSLAMATMRFAGGPLVERLGERWVLTLGGIMIAIGFAIAILAPTVWLSAFGFLIVGLGTANSFPVLIGAASRVPGVTPSVGVASVATAALFGFLLGPPIVGFIAQYHGLSVGLAALGVCGIIIVIGTNLYKWPQRG